MARLGPVSQLEILEIGSGRGDFSVYLSKEGAVVTGVDVGENLIRASRLLAEVNKVDCRFVRASVVELPFDAGSFDCVVGVGVLHHLSQKHLERAVREAHRVLRSDGRALFYGPIENSRVFDFVQNLIPVGGAGKDRYRPSILQRRAWTEYQRQRDDRPLTDQELIEAGGTFGNVAIIGRYSLLSRLWRVLGRRWRAPLEEFDAALLRAFPPLGYFAGAVLVEYAMTPPRQRRRAVQTLAKRGHQRGARRPRRTAE
jgi:SAM-dependent methyltransferase